MSCSCWYYLLTWYFCRRIEGELIANSVAVVHLTNATSGRRSARDVKSAHYYWTSDKNGAPSAIFDAKLFDHDIVEHRRMTPDSSKAAEGVSPQYRFWPYSGITIFSAPSPATGPRTTTNTRVVVIGQLVESIRWDMNAGGGTGAADMIQRAAGSLSFREVASVGVLVSRPYDPPDMWMQSSTALRLPSQWKGKGTFRWIALAVASGRPYASEDDMLYVMGVYDAQGAVRNTSGSTSMLAESNLFDIFAVSRTQQLQVVGCVRVRDLLDGKLGHFELLVSSDRLGTSSTVSSFVPLVQLEEQGLTSEAVAILPGVVSEASLHFDGWTKRWVVVSLAVSDYTHRVCFSADSSLTSHWQCISVGGIGAPWSDKHRYITYAGRAHPELDSLRGEARVISFATNLLTTPSDLFLQENKYAYCPLFLEYTIS